MPERNIKNIATYRYKYHYAGLVARRTKPPRALHRAVRPTARVHYLPASWVAGGGGITPHRSALHAQYRCAANRMRQRMCASPPRTHW